MTDKMTAIQIAWALAAVAAISVGQVLFKTAGLEIQRAGTWLSWRALLVVGLAAVIYAAATLLWINLLRQVPLNKAYVFMALSFLLVPIASHFVFHEPLTLGHWVGTALVVAGIVATVVWD